MNDLLSAWDATGVLANIELVSDVDDETLIPRNAEWMVKANIAIMIAGEYGIPISQSMAVDATQSVEEWLKATLSLTEVQPPATLPRGSGNRHFDDYETDFFIPTGSGKDNF